MSDNENSEKLLTSYFEKANKEEPVISVAEINNLIINLPFGDSSASLSNKTKQKVLAQYKYWLAGGLIICIGLIWFFTNSKQDINNNSNSVTNLNPQVNKIIYQEVAKINSTEKIKVDAKKFDTKEENEVAKVASKEKIMPSKIESKASISKNSSYYFPGDAKVKFELNGQSVLMIINEDVEQLEINGVLIDKSEYSEYATTIDEGKKLKLESDRIKFDTKDAESEQKQQNRKIMHGLIDELNADQMIDASGNFEFRISDLKLFINDAKQTDVVSEKYIKLYEALSGKQLTVKSNIRIKH